MERPGAGGDFNGDGWIDLATGNQNGNSVAIFLNNGAGSYLPPTTIPVGGAVHGLTVLDADRSASDRWTSAARAAAHSAVLRRHTTTAQ